MKGHEDVWSQPAATPSPASVTKGRASTRLAEVPDRPNLNPGLREAKLNGAGPLQPGRAGGVPTIVVYHNISSKRSPMTSQLQVTTTPDVFRQHLSYMAKNYDLIEPQDLFNGSLPKKPMLITFDDVYRSVLEDAGPILREFHAKSIWFLNPYSVEQEAVPFDNLLSLAVDQLGRAETIRLLGFGGSRLKSVSSLFSAHVPQLNSAQVADLKAAICVGLGTTQAELRRGTNMFLSAPEMQRLSEYGIQVGNHSMTHSYFRSLSPAELDIEIRQSREALERLSGQSVDSLAVPYGNECDATEQALAVARQSGHRAIFLVHARSNSRRPASDIYYRVDLGTVRTDLLPVSLKILPPLRTAWSRFN